MRQKNAIRKHFIAPIPKDGSKPKEADYMRLAKWISTVSDDTDEQTDDTGYYDGDGTAETTVTGVSGAYGFEGSHDPEDKAQAYIAGLKWKIGEERKVYHKIVSSDGKKQWIGKATVSAIIAGAGDATEYEDFSCTITFNEIPQESAVTPVG
ncbi:phage tail protein [Floricoccus tropicus]|uniref:Phage tail protein n=1 Tax=Floricoccus tropicus TaxID=1859473 RepID=A0A1E8GKV7_9LACT|nr:phage tail protein [Floricoccus tropicus]OFI48817.1 phage tail protein [Floricoccus tropicus]